MIAPRTDWTERIKEALAEENPSAMLADGFDDALLGITCNTHHPVVAVYDLAACVECLMRDGATAEKAEEYIAFNTVCAYVGEDGPLFIRSE